MCPHTEHRKFIAPDGKEKTVMKKCFAFGVMLALLLSCGAVFASAELPAIHTGWTAGEYLGGDQALYSSVGDITVAWKTDFASGIDLTDGNLADWYSAGLEPTNITVHNMISWYGDADSIKGDWKITTFSAADSTYLYLAFDVVDGDFAYGSDDGMYNGDAIQLALDFDGRLGELLKTDPDSMAGSVRNMFYSFSCEGDGKPIRIMRQESEQDGWLSEANGDGVKGAAKKTENGWSVELALSWQQLYDDYCFKAWEDPKIYIGGMEERPLKIGCCLYYLNRDKTAGDVLWAAGAIEEWKNDDGLPCVSWSPYDNSMMWVLPYERGMTFDCSGIWQYYVFETIAEETEPTVETETWWENTEIATVYPMPMPPEEYEQWEETVRDAAESLGKEDEINAILDKYGCTSAVGLGSLTALLTLAAAAYVIRKKK
jgi:hypothetical protein